eukprot:GFKZ01001537.1.p1 GENE.GFKZ01001537.1~~GFKZ01001537.1.p1  ORF type:complete len:591 (-),score=87.84 GFKZ01001537.1:1413-3185(-)
MATLQPPPVESPPSTAAQPATEDRNPVDQQWQPSSQEAPPQSAVDPLDANRPEPNEMYQPTNQTTNNSDPSDPARSQQTDPSNSADLAAQANYHQRRPQSVSHQYPHQNQLPQQSYSRSSQQGSLQQQRSHENPPSDPSIVGTQPAPAVVPTGNVGGTGPGGPPNSGGSKIFVGGLSWETDEDSMRRYFEQIGPVTDCVIMRDRHTGHPRGFGFVTFENDEAAGVAASRRHDLDGRQVEAKRAVPRNEGGSGGGGAVVGGGGGPHAGGGVFGPGSRGGSQQSGSRYGSEFGAGQGQGVHGGSGHRGHHTTKCKVFVGGLPSSCGGDEFRSYFSQFGEVVDAQVMIDFNTGNSRGFGFVTFANEATVNAVVGPGKSNTDHEIMGKCVEVKRAEPKGAPSDRRGNRDSYNSSGGGGGMRGSGGGNDAMSGGNSNGGGTNAAAAAAAAYYQNYPASIAEQYSAYYNNPQWQQYYAAMGYNFNAYPQGYNPYQQYLQAYMSSANAANGGSSGMGAGVSSDGAANSGAAAAGTGSGGASSGFDTNQGGAGRYNSAAGGNELGPATQNGYGGNGNSGGGPGSRRSARREDRYHPYR